ncbi:MAG: radical SAM protein [Spirochaetota bacterium]|nr:radical SAM protein [Spirochaetota bacterium]
MLSFKINDYNITTNKKGSNEYSKVSYPIRFGTYSIIETPEYIYHFNLNGCIKLIQSKDKNWPQDEWIKRTEGNDWIYYTPGIYTGLFSYIGEYYLPCFSYRSNSIFAFDPFVNNSVENAIKSLDSISVKALNLLNNNIPEELNEFLNLVASNNLNNLKLKSKQLHDIIGGLITVLPPDSRHVDYDVIPITIADGCKYKCKFCIVKNRLPFKLRSKNNILNQIRKLKDFYGGNISNYNSVYLGQHDALGAGEELTLFAAEKSYETFELNRSSMNGANLFLFASIDSFLNAKNDLFQSLNKTPFYTYINIGLESADNDTLEILRKPVSVQSVHSAFIKMMEVNKQYDKVEVTANFILSNELPDGHYPSIVDLVNRVCSKKYSKGGIYLSPLYNSRNGNIELQKKFIEIKNKIPIPAYIYLIQRL